MSSIGRKARNMMAGACRPTAATTRPSEAARLYPGEVEATPMTMPDSIPSAPDRRPFSPACQGSSRVTASATGPPPGAMIP
jgi:hypothetical protein